MPRNTETWVNFILENWTRFLFGFPGPVKANQSRSHRWHLETLRWLPSSTFPLRVAVRIIAISEQVKTVACFTFCVLSFVFRDANSLALCVDSCESRWQEIPSSGFCLCSGCREHPAALLLLTRPNKKKKYGTLVGVEVDFPTCVYKLEILLSSFQTSPGGSGLPSEKYGLFPLPWCIFQGLGGDAGAKWPGLRCFWAEGRQDKVRFFFLSQQMGDSLEVEECGDEGPGMKRRGRGNNLWIAFFFFLNSHFL